MKDDESTDDERNLVVTTQMWKELTDSIQEIAGLVDGLKKRLEHLNRCDTEEESMAGARGWDHGRCDTLRCEHQSDSDLEEDQSDSDLEEDQSDSDLEEETFEEIVFEGVEYRLYPDGPVTNDFSFEVGKWDTESKTIEFVDEDMEEEHRENRDS